MVRMNTDTRKKSFFNSSRLEKNMVGWLMMLPGLIFFVIFVWQPIISGIVTSFFETRGFDMIKFIGLENYKNVITDSLFLKSLANSCKYTFWSVLLGIPLPIIAAILLNEIIHGKAFFRFSVYFPCIIPGIVTSIMWKILLQPDQSGLINLILSKFGIAPLQWLQAAPMTIPLIVATIVWGGFGSTAILYLADLQSVNHDLYEAAEVDGAKFWGKLWHVTLPHMSGLIKPFVILQIIGAFKIFQQPLAMTAGGPANASTSLMMVSYDYAFSYMQVGRSTAVGTLTCMILAVFTVAYFRATREKDEVK